MGMFRDSASSEIDIIKEMAEGLGSSGLKVEDLLEKVADARERVTRLLQLRESPDNDSQSTDISIINDSIKEYNSLVDQAEAALRWLLIQREACGFRTHRNVSRHYPVPPKIRLLTE